MWIETIRDQSALDAAWLPWEQLRAEGSWPGLFATTAGFRWLLRNGLRATHPWVLSRWEGRRLTGVLPLLAASASAGSPPKLQLPPLACVPLGSQPTVFLLEVFQNWERLGGQAGGLRGCWPWLAGRPQGRWAVVARWRRWAVQRGEPLWRVFPSTTALARGAALPRNSVLDTKLLTALPDSCAENWDHFSWRGWQPDVTGDPHAWWQLAELLCRHNRLLLVECRRGDEGRWRFLAAREPWGAVLLARAEPQGECVLPPPAFPQPEGREPAVWFVPSAWLPSEIREGADLHSWWFSPVKASRRKPWVWLSQGLLGLSKKKPRRHVSRPAW